MRVQVIVLWSYLVYPEFETWNYARDFCYKPTGTPEIKGELACLKKGHLKQIIEDAGHYAKDGVLRVWTRLCDNPEYTPYWAAYIQISDIGIEYSTFAYEPQKVEVELPFYCLQNVEELTTVTTQVIPTTELTTVTTQVIPTTKPPVCCPKILVRKLQWNETCGHFKVSQDCPGINQNGIASWSCNYTVGKWFPPSPDLSGCRSNEVLNILNSLNTSDVTGTYNEISNAATKADTGGDIIIISDVILNVTSSLVKDDNITDAEWLGKVENVADSLSDTMDTLLGSNVWSDIPKNGRSEVASDLLKSYKKLGFSLTHALNDSVHIVSKDLVYLQAINREKGWYKDKNLTITSDDRNFDVSLPSGFEDDIPKTDSNAKHTSVVITSFKNMGDILLVGEGRSLPNYTEMTRVNSPVLGLNLIEGESSINLTNEIRFIVAHKDRNADSPLCVFWNVLRKTWDTDGCRSLDSNLTHTTCACDHLTNFAVLMDVHGALDSFSDADKRALTVITYIGCIISIIALTVCVLLTTCLRQLWCVRNTIHRNLSLCLLIAEVFLLTGLERTENKALCSAIAGILHYFFLSAFFWMLLESVYIYILLCKVFQPVRSYTERYYLFGYGLPLLIVAISAGSNSTGYGTQNYCWLSVENGMMWSFGAPVLVIILINLVALIYALRMAIHMSKKKTDNNEEAARKWIFGALTLVPLLGLTWGIGFLFWKDSGPAGAYIFTILNSLQGLAIFSVQVIMNKKVRDLLRRKLLNDIIRIAPSSKTGTNRPTTSTSEGRNGQSSNTTSRTSSQKESLKSKNSYCPDSPVSLFNEVNSVFRSTNSYNISNGNSKTNKADDVVRFGTGEEVTGHTPVILRLKIKDDDATEI